MNLIIEFMIKIFLLLLIPCLSAWASVVGISTHPLNEEGRLLSAGMTGYMSQHHEVGMGLRYTQEIIPGQIFDMTVSGAQDSRGLVLGGGMDFEVLHEEESQPRFSLKPYYQFQKQDADKSNLLGFAPTLRKGFSISGLEFFPFLALPSGLKIDSSTDIFVYYASLTLGASMPLPVAGGDKLLASIETNKNLGASSDYVGVLISWVWK
jgi:hypothetical protein